MNLTSYPPYLNLGNIPIFLFFLEERGEGGVREAENWIIILVSGKGEKSAGKCCVTRQNINIYKIIIFSFLYTVCVRFY